MEKYTVKLTIKLEKELDERLSRECMRDSLPKSAWIRNMIAVTLNERDEVRQKSLGREAGW